MRKFQVLLLALIFKKYPYQKKKKKLKSHCYAQ